MYPDDLGGEDAAPFPVVLPGPGLAPDGTPWATRTPDVLAEILDGLKAL